MHETFNLELNNDPDISTTRNNTCIDAIFTRHIEQLRIRDYILFFSYHNPLLSVIDVSDHVQKSVIHVYIHKLLFINYL